MRVALSRIGEGETLQQVNYNNGLQQKMVQNSFCKTSNETEFNINLSRCGSSFVSLWSTVW